MGGSSRGFLSVSKTRYRYLINYFVTIFILIQLINCCDAYFYSEKRNESGEDRNCFCQLKGSVDDCSCSIDTVDYFNNNKIHPRLQSLLVRDYFRFYKVNLRKECPFWADDSQCAMRSCHVSTCSENDVPEGLKGQHQQESFMFKYLPESQQIDDCMRDHNLELSYLNKTLTQEAMHGFEIWADFDGQKDNFCILDDHENGSEYVDLLLNPERFTGYRGESAHRIWHSVYMENCFDQTSTNALLTHINKVPKHLNNLCMEQRAFYRLLSGMHTSINIHLCSYYLLNEGSDFMSDPQGVWGRNVDEFMRRFSPETTKDEGPSWLKNLYFIYLLEMRAIAKAAPFLRNEQFFTGDEDEDESVQAAVKDILNIIESFPQHFEESLMFNGTAAAQLKADFREKFRNISKIMDCVGCDKCRLWGKLQVQGLGTALKILYSGKFDGDIDFNENQPKNIKESLRQRFKLKRGEIVSLFNAFGRLSNSINELEEFRKVTR
ncbi:ero1-like protein [Sitodiplosis mosellana]|uniref:ero1-like protein n=1 Tax=Sitodiplosis mosellana TaxID=263140 RepID=UPI002444E21C|nr:ero1-like protein [Sitodiplosis mosellana]